MDKARSPGWPLVPLAIGGLFSAVLLTAFGTGLRAHLTDPPPESAAEAYHLAPGPLSLSSDGIAGRFDPVQLRRGFEVYRQVCSSCHSLKFLAFRNLGEIGYSAAQVKAIARDWPVQQPSDNPDTGDATTRPSLPADRFPPPFANDDAARAANNNAIPPDLTLMTKAREGGAAYVHSLLTGYRDPPPSLAKRFPESATSATSHYNPYFANLNIAMPPPLVAAGQVSYDDGHVASVDQMAKDVAAFLVWTAEPRLDDRRRLGTIVLAFLGVLAAITAVVNVRTWRALRR